MSDLLTQSISVIIWYVYHFTRWHRTARQYICQRHLNHFISMPFPSLHIRQREVKYCMQEMYSNLTSSDPLQ